jgi:hypothetical protein
MNYMSNDIGVRDLRKRGNHLFVLVEPVAKTPYPPLGLMKISSMLKDRVKGCHIVAKIGNSIDGLREEPTAIFITSLFTWDWKSVVESIKFYKSRFPDSEVIVGGVAASLLANAIETASGIKPYSGLHGYAEFYAPDYSMMFNRKDRVSIAFTTRGCPNKCKFCSVRKLEPEFFVKEGWEKDVNGDFGRIVFWDNNFLASPNFVKDCEKILALGKKVDFNQGLEARLYDKDKARILARLNIDPLRFAFDDIRHEQDVVKAIRLAKKHTKKEICVYALYNFEDSPEDLFYRIDLLNREGVLCFPMEYRAPNKETKRFPNRFWNGFLLRAFKLSLLFYYRKGMITEKRESFQSIYGRSASEFVSKLYEIYQYDKSPLRGKAKLAACGGPYDK